MRIRTIAIATLVLLLLVSFSLPAFSQSLRVMGGGGDPTPVPTVPQVFCQGDRVLAGSVNAVQGKVWEICNTKDSIESRVVLPDTLGVQTILTTPSGNFYALSADTAWKSTPYEVTTTPIISNGFRSDADPIVFNEYGWYYDNSITMRLPGAKNRTYKVSVYGDGSSYNQKMQDDPRDICANVVNAGTPAEACLDMVYNVVFQPSYNPFGGVDYRMGKEYFVGRNPVNMVAGADGNTYVLLAGTPLPTVGKPAQTPFGTLATITRTRTGDTVERTLLTGLSISPDAHVQSMAAGQLGIYIITSEAQGTSSWLWLYAYGTGALTKLGTSLVGQTLSGLAVLPANQYVQQNNVVGKGLSVEP